MNIEVRTVKTKKDLKKFIKLPFEIYKHSPNWIPLLIMDELEIFNKKKNPAYEKSDSRLFLAYKDGKPAGRIVGIISYIANEKYKTRNVRFGWFEAINDFEVCSALFNAVENWGKENGMKALTGPLGFTDLDPEGMMIQGFDEQPTIASNYNHPYYQALLEKYGFQKEIDYIEFKAKIPSEEQIPEKLLRLAERIKERGSLKILEFKKKKEVTK